jgi:hypothetical protein
VTVEGFPAVEPWPAELFDQYGLRDLERLVVDAQAEIRRRKNAARLSLGKATGPARELLDGDSVQGQEVSIMAVVPGCTCGGRGVCAGCVLDELDRHDVAAPGAVRMSAALRGLTAAGQPTNVVELHGHSKKVPS